MLFTAEKRKYLSEHMGEDWVQKQERQDAEAKALVDAAARGKELTLGETVRVAIYQGQHGVKSKATANDLDNAIAWAGGGSTKQAARRKDGWQADALKVNEALRKEKQDWQVYAFKDSGLTQAQRQALALILPQDKIDALEQLNADAALYIEAGDALESLTNDLDRKVEDLTNLANGLRAMGNAKAKQASAPTVRWPEILYP